MLLLVSLPAVAVMLAPTTPLSHSAALRPVSRSAVKCFGGDDATRDPEPLIDGEKPSSFADYLKQRDSGTVQGGSIDEAMDGLRAFQAGGGDMEFDGGDSGGGVVGDGNTDLEDQHNSASIVRGGFGEASVSGMGAEVGRGKVAGATEARTAAAGKNYFGRTTGYAEKLINEISEADVKAQKMDTVRAQQKENWFNQRAIHAANRAAGQGVVFGEEDDIGEVSQRDLADHLSGLAAKPAERLDGEAWGSLDAAGLEYVEVYEMKSRVGNTAVQELAVKNDLNTFAPYQAGFIEGSSAAFKVTPTAGTMNRRSGEPVSVVVRFTPKDYGTTQEAVLVFETEDMKKAWKFIGSV